MRVVTKNDWRVRTSRTWSSLAFSLALRPTNRPLGGFSSADLVTLKARSSNGKQAFLVSSEIQNMSQAGGSKCPDPGGGRDPMEGEVPAGASGDDFGLEITATMSSVINPLGSSRVQIRLSPLTESERPAFDPLAALYGTATFPGFDPNARVYDNVEQLLAHRDGRIEQRKKKIEANQVQAQAEAAQAPLERQFRPEQMPVQVQRRPRKNVLTYMERVRAKGGPMGFLADCVEGRIRVKVVLRGADRIRGSLEAYIVAFDKYWNLALVDVDEIYTRKRLRPAMVTEEDPVESSLWAWRTRPPIKGSQRKKKPLKTERMGEIVVYILKTRRKTELCQRHILQTLLRGEHIVTVAKLTAGSN